MSIALAVLVFRKGARRIRGVDIVSCGTLRIDSYRERQNVMGCALEALCAISGGRLSSRWGPALRDRTQSIYALGSGSLRGRTLGTWAMGTRAGDLIAGSRSTCGKQAVFGGK